MLLTSLLPFASNAFILLWISKERRIFRVLWLEYTLLCRRQTSILSNLSFPWHFKLSSGILRHPSVTTIPLIIFDPIHTWRLVVGGLGGISQEPCTKIEGWTVCSPITGKLTLRTIFAAYIRSTCTVTPILAFSTRLCFAYAFDNTTTRLTCRISIKIVCYGTSVKRFKRVPDEKHTCECLLEIRNANLGTK